MRTRIACFILLLYLSPCSAQTANINAHTGKTGIIKQHGKYGYADAAGRIVVPCIYDRFGYFIDSLAVVEKNGKTGLVHISGKEVTPCIYDQILYGIYPWGHNPGHPLVKLNGKYGVLNRSGSLLIPTNYDELTYAGRNFYTARIGQGYGLLRAGGHVVIPFGKYTDFEYQDSANFFIAATGKKYGCIDTFGNVVTPFVYDGIGQFKEHIHDHIYVHEYVHVCKGNGYGYTDHNRYGCIDRKGKEVVPCEYDHFIYREHGYWVVKIDDKYGLVNPAGKRIIPCLYDHLGYNGDGTVITRRDKKYSVLDTNNKVLFTTTIGSVESYDVSTGIAHINIDGYTEIDVDKNGNKVYIDYKPGAYTSVDQFCNGVAKVQNQQGYYGLVNTAGKEILPCRYDKIYGFYEGMARVVDNRKYGFVNLSGQLLIPCQYGSAASFSEGLAAVEVNNKWGYIDRTGKMIISPVYEYAESFSEDRAAFRSGEKYGFIDKSGSIVIPAIYERVGDFNEGLAFAENCDDHWEQCMGYIDKSGSMVIPFRHTGSAHSEFSNGLACVGTYKKLANSNPRRRYGVINKAGNIIVPCKYSYDIRFKNSGLARVIDCEEHGCSSGCVNKKGTVILPCEYGSIEVFPGNIIAASKKYKWALFDSTGRQITGFEWDKVHGSKEFPLAVEKDKHWGFIDEQGKTVIPFIYDEVLWKDYVGGFCEGLAAVSRKGKWQFLDRQGKAITGLVYDEVCHFAEGLAAVKKDGKWGYINRQGEEVVRFK